MDCIMDNETARTLVSDPVLWPRMRDFLWDFVPQVHVSWLEGLGLESLGVKSGEGLSKPGCVLPSRIKAYILRELGVEPCFYPFPTDDGSRMMLLDSSTLESIARWLGALACSGSLRRVTDGAMVRELRAALPGVYPEVFGYTMYFEGLYGRCAKEANTPGEIVSTGLAMLFSLFASLPSPLVLRLKLKLPRRMMDLCSRVEGAQVPLKYIPKLLKLKFPEAYALCCS